MPSWRALYFYTEKFVLNITSQSPQISPQGSDTGGLRKTNKQKLPATTLNTKVFRYTEYFAQTLALQACKVLRGKYEKVNGAANCEVEIRAQRHSASLSIKTGLMMVPLHLGTSCPYRDCQQPQKKSQNRGGRDILFMPLPSILFLV